MRTAVVVWGAAVFAAGCGGGESAAPTTTSDEAGAQRAATAHCNVNPSAYGAALPTGLRTSPGPVSNRMLAKGVRGGQSLRVSDRSGKVVGEITAFPSPDAETSDNSVLSRVLQMTRADESSVRLGTIGPHRGARFSARGRVFYVIRRGCQVVAVSAPDAKTAKRITASLATDALMVVPQGRTTSTVNVRVALRDSVAAVEHCFVDRVDYAQCADVVESGVTFKGGATGYVVSATDQAGTYFEIRQPGAARPGSDPSIQLTRKCRPATAEGCLNGTW